MFWKKKQQTNPISLPEAGGVVWDLPDGLPLPVRIVPVSCQACGKPTLNARWCNDTILDFIYKHHQHPGDPFWMLRVETEDRLFEVHRKEFKAEIEKPSILPDGEYRAVVGPPIANDVFERRSIMIFTEVGGYLWNVWAEDARLPALP